MNIYLSPHHDDICFSLSSFASRHGGEIINIFTRSCYVAVPMDLPADSGAKVDFISKVRLDEDLSFVRSARLNRHDLEMEEPGLIGYEPFDLENLDAAVARTSERLIPFLLHMLPHEGDPRNVSLFCPAGIGGHRDHVSTLKAVRESHEMLRHRCTVYLYEDLHYASDPKAREAGLQRAAQIFAGAILSPTFHVMNAREANRKMEMIRLYASQHPRSPAAPRFTPASPLKFAPHEIFWHVDMRT